MTQPRKEQVKNLKTKSTLMDSVGPTSLGGGFVVQDLINADYTAFLDQSVTGLVDGADTSSSPTLLGGVGPFINIVAGNSFTITLPGVNFGLPITATVLVSDIVTISGNPVITTSRAAAIINRTLALYGVTVPAANNVNGRLVVTGSNTLGKTYGNDSFVTLTDVTAGILAKLGYAISPSTANGTTAPNRGLVTLSSDGLGGRVSLRQQNDDNASLSQAVTSNPSLLTFPSSDGVLRYTEETLPGQTIEARLRHFPGTPNKFEISYYKNGVVRASLITSQSDFSSLSADNTIVITVDDSARNVSQNFSVNFATPPTNPQSLINIINSQWNAQTLADTTHNAGAAAAILDITGPYAFGASESFFIQFQSGSTIHIEPDETVVSVADLAAFIQAEIATAGDDLLGQAVVITDPITTSLKVILRSLNTSGPSSEIIVYPGDPGGSNPGVYTGTLDKIGLMPGTYKGSAIAFLYGADEVVFRNPSYNPNSGISISGIIANESVTMALLGFSTTTVQSFSGPGIEPVISPVVHALIPEVMEFGEVPDGVDTVAQSFLNTNDPPTASINSNPFVPGTGLTNYGLSAVLNQSGQIFSNLIPKYLPQLNTDQIVLGSQKTGIAADLAVPRVTVPVNGVEGPTLIWESTDPGISHQRIRLYDIGRTQFQTTNAKFDGTNWSKDVTGVVASVIVTTNGSTIHGRRSATDNTPWPDTEWVVPVRMFPAIDVGTGTYAPASLLELGDEVNELDESFLRIPRIQFRLKDQIFTLTEQYRNLTAVGPSAREYVYPGPSVIETREVLNAWDDGANWNKDANGNGAIQITTTNDPSWSVKFRQNGNDAPWADNAWDVTPFEINGNTSIPSGARNLMRSPLRVNSVRRMTSVSQTDISGPGLMLVLAPDINADNSDTFIFNATAAGTVAGIDMVTNMSHIRGDKFEVIFRHTGGALNILAAGVWGINVKWENPLDELLSGVQGYVDIYTFINLGTSQIAASRLLLGSVKRFQNAT